MGAIAEGLLVVLGYVESMLMVLIIASIICSWVSADPRNPIVQMIFRVTEPMFRPFRKVLGGLIPGIDLSPILLILCVKFGFTVVTGLLSRYLADQSLLR